MPSTLATIYVDLASALPIASGPQSSFLVWLVGAMSIGGLFAFVLDLVIFVGACYVAIRVRRIEVIAAYLLFVPVPVLIALSVGLRGVVSSFATAAMLEVEMPQSFVIHGLVEPIAMFCTSVFFSVLSYILLTISIFVRTLSQSRSDAQLHQ